MCEALPHAGDSAGTQSQKRGEPQCKCRVSPVHLVVELFTSQQRTIAPDQRFSQQKTWNAAIYKYHTITKFMTQPWQCRVLATSISWFFLIIFIFALQLFKNKWSMDGVSYEFYLRVLCTVPIAYYLFFCVSQFNTIRKAHERYAFKTTVALSIEAHADLLRKIFNSEIYEKEILNFSLEALKKVYDEPFYRERARENIDLKKCEAKQSQKNLLPLELLEKKDSELYKLLNNVFDRTMPKSS